jgi:hypothetical protein
MTKVINFSNRFDYNDYIIINEESDTHDSIFDGKLY